MEDTYHLDGIQEALPGHQYQVQDLQSKEGVECEESNKKRRVQNRLHIFQ